MPDVKTTEKRSWEGEKDPIRDWLNMPFSDFLTQLAGMWQQNRFPWQPESSRNQKLFGWLGGSQPSPTGVTQRTTDILSDKFAPPEQDLPQPNEGAPINEDRWEIESIGGQDYIVLVHYDEKGKRTINPGEIPKPVKKELTQGDKLMQDYYDLQRQKELMQFQRDLNTPRPQVNNTALAQQLEFNRQWELDQQRVQMAGQFEKARQEILSSTAPRDWVIREKAIRAQNPFGAPATAFGPTDTVGSGAYARSLMGAPEIPEDIRQFVGAGTGAEKEFGTQIAPPSGQQWTRSPWDTREMLAGYAEAFGEGGFQNLQEEMRRRQPYNPSRGAMWSPTRQR